MSLVRAPALDYPSSAGAADKEAFAGAALSLGDLNARLLLGEEIDLLAQSQAVNALVKLALAAGQQQGRPRGSARLADLPARQDLGGGRMTLASPPPHLNDHRSTRCSTRCCWAPRWAIAPRWSRWLDRAACRLWPAARRRAAGGVQRGGGWPQSTDPPGARAMGDPGPALRQEPHGRGAGGLRRVLHPAPAGRRRAGHGAGAGRQPGAGAHRVPVRGRLPASVSRCCGRRSPEVTRNEIACATAW